MRVYRLGVLSPALYQPALIIVHITIADRNHRRHLPKCARYERPNHIPGWSDLVVMFLSPGECWGWNLVWWQIIVDTIIADCNLDVMPLLTRPEFAKYVGSNMLSWGKGSI